MNHQAEIEGINNCPVKSESAIMACNRLAVLSCMFDDVARLKAIFGLLLRRNDYQDKAIRFAKRLLNTRKTDEH